MSTKHVARVRLVLAVLVAAGAVGVALIAPRGPAPALAAQPKDEPGAKKGHKIDPLLPKTPDDGATSFLACAKCHNEKAPLDIKGNIYAQRFKSHHFVLFSEGRTWTAEDPHSTAYKVLEGPLGQQMSRILAVDETGKPKPGYTVTKDARCLTCHAIDMAPQAPFPPKAEELANRFDTSDGVTCNACHGLLRPWQQEHYEDKAAPGGGRYIPWRTYTPERKEQSGLRNLRDPVVKAKLCASCHVGDPDLNRVVTHDMYAAGHPPLPPFELGMFMENEPKHWGYPIDPTLEFFTDKGYKDYTKADPPANWTWNLYRFYPADKEVYLARQITAGAIASLHAEMKQLAAEAELVLAGGGGALDFARFDCYACHHDLVIPSPRQERGYTGRTPGVPTLKAWSGALPSVVVSHAATLQVGDGKPFAEVTKDFDAKWGAVQKAANVRPFGRPKEVATAAHAMAEWCEKFMAVQQSVAAPIYTPANAESLVSRISAAALDIKWNADPEAAMHLTWSYIALREHMGTKLDKGALEKLGMRVPVRVRYQREDPMNKGKWAYSNEKGEPLSVGETLRTRLDLFNKYNTKDFVDAFRGVSK